MSLLCCGITEIFFKIFFLFFKNQKDVSDGVPTIFGGKGLEKAPAYELLLDYFGAKNYCRGCPHKCRSSVLSYFEKNGNFQMEFRNRCRRCYIDIIFFLKSLLHIPLSFSAVL